MFRRGIEHRGQVAALDFAGGTLGQRGEDVDFLGHFEVGEVTAAMRHQLRRADVISQDHRCPHFFTILGIGYAERGCFCDRWMLEEDGVDLGG